MAQSKRIKSLPKKRSNVAWIIGGAAALLAACCVFIFVLGLINNAFESAGLLPTDTPQPEPTATSVPAESPPTATPEPTAIPTPALSPEELGYLDGVQDQLELLFTAFDEISQLTAAPNLGSQDWRIDTTTQIYIVQDASQALGELTPPASMAEFHADLVEAMEACDQYVGYLKTGIDEVDVNDLEISRTWMETCGIRLELLPDQIKTFN